MPKNTNALVREFHETFRAAVATETSITTGFEELRANLIIEEAAETLLAIMSSDNVEFADGLGDLDYVIEGAAITFGINLDEIFDLAMKSHAHYAFYELIGLLVLGVKSLVEVLKEETRGEVDNQGYEIEDVEALLAHVKAIVWTMANQWGIPLKEIIDAIHESNMSKLDVDGSVLLRADGKIQKGPNFFTPTEKIKALLGV